MGSSPKIGVYPGSFDPITNGHLDIVERARLLFDRLVVAVAVNSSKKCLFTVPERVELIQEVLINTPTVEVSTFSGLLVDFAYEIRATAIVRGIRAVTDFEYEYAIYQMNRDLNQDVDTVFLLAVREHSFLSSSIIKEVACYGRDVTDYAPEVVNRALLQKFGHLT